MLTSPLESRGYVDLTLDVLNKFGVTVDPRENGFHVPGGQKYRAGDLAIEADWSQAAFWYAANHLGGQGGHSGPGSKFQAGDREVAAYCREAGPARGSGAGRVPVPRPGAAPWRAIAAVRAGTTRLTNAARLRMKGERPPRLGHPALRAMGDRWRST